MITIDEAIAFCKNQISFSNEEYKKLASWLEELKELKYAYYKGFKEGKRIGYNKALEDFEKEMIRSSLTEREKEYIRYKAEQLKEGAEE